MSKGCRPILGRGVELKYIEQSQNVKLTSGKSEMHVHYHRKNCNKTRAFVGIKFLT